MGLPYNRALYLLGGIVFFWLLPSHSFARIRTDSVTLDPVESSIVFDEGSEEGFFSKFSSHQAALSKETSSKRKRVKIPKVLVEHLTTHEKHYLQADLPGLNFSKKQLASMSHLLRCHHTHKQMNIHPYLISILYQTAVHYGNAKITIIAGYRAPEIARKKGNPNSPHQKGIASDIRIAGVTNEDLRDYLRETFHPIGVGYYPNSGFIHVDVGRKVSGYWIDYSSPGQQAWYLSPRKLRRNLYASAKFVRHFQRRSSLGQKNPSLGRARASLKRGDSSLGKSERQRISEKKNDTYRKQRNTLLPKPKRSAKGMG